MRSNKFLGFLLIALFAISTQTVAQDYDKYDELEYRKWRVTIIPPLSTNGARTTDFTAKDRSILLVDTMVRLMAGKLVYSTMVQNTILRGCKSQG